jgi:hypothetical protein
MDRQRRRAGSTSGRQVRTLSCPHPISGLLVPQGEWANSDGQKFLAADGRQLIVFGSNNALNEPLKNAFAATGSRLAVPSGKVTYRVLKPDWFVVSVRTARPSSMRRRCTVTASSNHSS